MCGGVSDTAQYSVDDILEDVRRRGEENEVSLIDDLFNEPEDNSGFSVSVESSGASGVFEEIEEAAEEEETEINETVNPVEKSEDSVQVEVIDEDEDMKVYESLSPVKAEDEDDSPDAEPEEDVKIYGADSGNDDFSFNKLYEESKKRKEEISKTRVFDSGDIEKAGKTPNDSTRVISEEEPQAQETQLEKELRVKRQKKIDKFRLFTENMSDEDFEEENDSVSVTETVSAKKGEDIFKVIESAEKPRKENSKRREKRKQRDSKVYDKIDVGRVRLRLENDFREIKIRRLVALITFVICLVLGVMRTLFVAGKAEFLSGVFGQNPVIIYAAELLLGLPMLVLSLRAFIIKLRDSERPTLNSQAMTALLFAVSTVHSTVLVLMKPEMDKSVLLFGTAVCFVALLQLHGERKENRMIKRNLEALIRNDRFNGVFALENNSEKLASGISRAKEPLLLCAGEVEIPDSFLDSSFIKDKENTFFNIALPSVLALSIVCGVMSAIAYGGVTAFSAAVISALLVSSPVFIAPVLVSLIARVNETLNRTGCEILGYEDVEGIDDADAIVLDTADIFSGNISHFHLISRTVRIDTLHAFEIACSVLYSSGGVLKNEIAELMKEQKIVLPEVEDIKYEERLGISCWVEDKCVLLGTAQMMKEHNIEIPEEYSGEKYERDGRKVFYLAVDTYATAMFCAEYFIGRQVRKQLVDLYATGVILMLMTTDPHIDEQFVANTLGVSSSSIKAISPVGAKQIRETMEKTTRQKRTGLIFKKSIVGLLKVINSAFRLYDVQSLGILIQIVSIIFGIVVSGVLSAAATGYLPGVIFIIAYHTIWAVLGYFVTHKNKK